MANYIVSYDLNGPRPTHAQMDEHMGKAGWARGRILETVWYVGTGLTADQVHDHISKILSGNDLLLVVEASYAVWNELIIDDASLRRAWAENL